MANPKLKIDTPRGSLYTQASKSGKVTAILEWNKGFGAEFTEKFSSAQKFVDSEVLRLDAPYMPIDTGMVVLKPKCNDMQISSSTFGTPCSSMPTLLILK